MRFWVADTVVKKKIEDWNRTDLQMAGALKLMRDQFQNAQEKAQVEKLMKEHPQEQAKFFYNNLNNPKMPAPWKEWIEKRHKLEDEIKIGPTDKMPDPAYVLARLTDLSTNAFLGDFKWKGGVSWKAKAWGPHLPTDSELIMYFFCQLMDEILGPAVIFSESHFIKLNHYKKKVEEGRHRFDTVAIVETTIPIPEREKAKVETRPFSFQQKEQPKVEPYFYLVYKEEKKDDGDEKKEEESTVDHSVKLWGRKTKEEGTVFPAWYPRPGPDNLFHCL